MDNILVISMIALGGLGLIFGICLAIFSRRFSVKVDPRIERIMERLPGTNCGACGMAGCRGFATGLVGGKAEVSGCPLGGSEVSTKLAEIMGVEAKEETPQVAIVQCQGGRREAKQRFIYHGVEDCDAAILVSSGPKACDYGCLGFGTCVEACPFGALSMNENGLPVVDEDLCTGCGLCVEACPRNILKLIPQTQKVFLGCVSEDKGKEVKDICSLGCIGCKLCASPKVTPSGAIRMEGNLPVIDPSKGNDLANAVQKCPSKSFVVRSI